MRSPLSSARKNQKQLANVSLSKLPEFVLVRKSGLLARFFMVSGVLEDYGYFQTDCHERARYRADPRFFVTAGGAGCAARRGQHDCFLHLPRADRGRGAVGTEYGGSRVPGDDRLEQFQEAGRALCQKVWARLHQLRDEAAALRLPCGQKAAAGALPGMRHHRGSDFYRCDRRKPLRDEICSAYADRAGRRDHLQNAQALRERGLREKYRNRKDGIQ